MFDVPVRKTTYTQLSAATTIIIREKMVKGEGKETVGQADAIEIENGEYYLVCP